MNPQHERFKEILAEAAAKRTPGERAAYLEGACRGDAELRARVEALLGAYDQAGGFLEAPVVSVTQQAMDVPNSPTEMPGDRIGRYKLLQQIGEGGCGVVYMAEQEEPVRRRVALKVIKLGMDTKQVIARFEAERQALALMDHPSIAKVLDAGATEHGRPYFVMELVRGLKITDYCNQNQLPTPQRLQLFIRVCHAIQHAHQKGIIHRDIKPSNVLVSLLDGEPVPVVIDFGVAKAIEQRLTDKTLFTAFEQFIGTPAYMSPEQAEWSRMDIDTRSDIYALGVLLYELLTGKTPFDAKELIAAGLEEMRRTIREKEPAKPSTRLTQEIATASARRLEHAGDELSASLRRLLQEVRGDLDWIVMKCLEKHRSRRYASANDLALDVQHHLAHEPILAHPPTAAYRFEKLVRRHRAAFAAGSLVVSALVLGTLVSIWQATVATRARKTAEAAQVAETRQRLAAETAQQRAEAETARARHQLYVANMNLVPQAWDQHNAKRVRQLLEVTASDGVGRFEWDYWQRQTHQELMTLRGHDRWMCSVAFSPDGQRIVTGDLDGTAKVWEAADGKELLTLKGHRYGVRSVAFSPNGRRIVTASEDRSARVWDSVTGEPLLTFREHCARVLGAAFSPDGRWIVTGGADRLARVWDAFTGRQRLSLKGHTGEVWSVAFSANGQRIVTLGHDDSIRVWEAETGNEVLILKGQGVGWSVAISPDGQRITAGSGGGPTTTVWETASGKPLLTLSGHETMIYSVAFSPDGQRILTGSYDQTAKVWEAATGKELLTLKGHNGAVAAAVFSPDGRLILTGSGDATARVWDAVGRQEPRSLAGHSQAIFSIAFSPDGQRIVTGSGDTTAKVWDGVTGKELLTLQGHSKGVQSAVFSTDRRWIATGSEDGTARLWDAVNGRDLFTFAGHSAEITGVAFSPDGRWLVTGSSDRTAKCWDLANKQQSLTLKGHGGEISRVSISPDGKRILTGSADGTATVWEAASGKELLTLKAHAGPIIAATFSPEGKRILTGSYDWTAKVWDAALGQEITSFKGHRAWIRCAAFSPDGQRVVSAGDDMTARVWDAAGGEELLTLPWPASFIITAIAFSPDGLRIVAASSKGTTKVWEAAAPRQAVAWQTEEQAEVRRLALREHAKEVEAERERVLRERDPGLSRWLVLAPIPFQDRDGAAALQQEQIPGEALLRPHAGERFMVGDSERVWRAAQLEDSSIDFNRVIGAVSERSVAYAVAYIRSQANQTGLLLKVGSDDQAKVYLNGKEVYQQLGVRRWRPDEDVVTDVELRAGMNVLVFKAVNEEGTWQGSVRFTDAAGQPVKGITVGLEPE